jgi:hypothetical protein
MTTQATTTPEQRVRKARKVAADAIKHATVINLNPELARSTRSRAGYKVRSDALGKVLAILSGKE